MTIHLRTDTQYIQKIQGTKTQQVLEMVIYAPPKPFGELELRLKPEEVDGLSVQDKHEREQASERWVHQYVLAMQAV